MNIQDFIEDYVEGEPLTPNVVAWAIKKYININYEPTKKEQLEMYEKLLHLLAANNDDEHPVNIKKLLLNITNWSKARLTALPLNPHERHCCENETFYNLCKL